jgi:hypothetical protein
VGGLEPPDHIFGSVVDATRLPDGRVAVVDRQARSVALFGPDGALLQTLGREGEGPGEFLDPIGIDHAGDTLAVWDWDQVRVTEFDLTDGTVATHALDAIINPAHHFGFSEGGFVVASALLGRTPSSGLSPRTLRVFRFADDDSPPDTVAEFTESMSGWVDEEARFMGSPTFAPRGTLAVVHRHTASGAADLTWEWPTRPVATEDFEAYRDRRLERASESLRPMLEKQFEVMPVAEVFPVAVELLPDREEGVWVEIYPTPRDSLETWLRVIDAGVDCRLALPASFELMEGSADWLLGYDEDELGVQTVQLWNLEN